MAAETLLAAAVLAVCLVLLAIRAKRPPWVGLLLTTLALLAALVLVMRAVPWLP